jgi:hypothetical protein
LVSAPAALLGTVVALTVMVRSGPGVTPDSVVYLSSAQSLLHGDGFRGPDGGPYLAFPPLFPALIATATLGVADPAEAARALVAVSFGITILASGWIAGRVTHSRIVAVVAGIAVLVSTPLLDTSFHIWSEAPFAALAMSCLGAMSVGVVRPSARSSGAAIVLASLASLTRYIGVALTFTHLALIGLRTDATVTARLRSAGVGLIGLMPLLLWLGRNLLVSGTIAGERYPSADPLLSSIRDIAEVMLRWSTPVDLPIRLRAVLVLLVGAALMLPLVSAVRNGEPRTRECLRMAIPFALFCLLYILYLVAAASLTALDPIDDRLLAPLVPAIVVLAAVVIHVAWSRVTPGRHSLVRTITLLAIGVWLAASAVGAIRLVRDIDQRGIGGYASPRWRGSEVLRFVGDDLPPGLLYSNDPFAIYYWTGRTARLSPRRHPYRSPHATVDDLQRLRDETSLGRPVYLVWFDTVPRDFLLSVAELDIIVELQPVARLGDGTVYRVSPASDAAQRVLPDGAATESRVPFWSTR